MLLTHYKKNHEIQEFALNDFGKNHWKSTKDPNGKTVFNYQTGSRTSQNLLEKWKLLLLNWNVFKGEQKV